VRKHVQPTWNAMINIGESRYRIGSDNDAANATWERIKAKHFDEPEQATACQPQAAE